MAVSHYRDIDFRPAPPGWRMYFLAGNGVGLRTYPVAGWLIQEATGEEYEPQTEVPAQDRDRRVVPAFWNRDFGVELQPADLGGDDPQWVLGPGQPDPTAEEIAEAHRAAAQAQTEKANGELAGRCFDEIIAPEMRSVGIPTDMIRLHRRRYVRETCADPEALRRLQAWAG
jgi:hypothetical protein